MTVPRQMFDFIIGPIRLMDRREGNDFYKRWFIGAQEIWETIDARIQAIPTLWSVTECPDEQLQFLKWIVGWTSELDDVTRELTFIELRRLISTSVRMWKLRGPEDTTIDVLFFSTAARNRIWNWFDMRWVLDETEMGEEHEGRDPWLLDLPEPDTAGAEMESNLRIVDDGTLNRNLVVSLTKLMRATNERIEITYLTFLDQFIIAGDDTQWTKPIGTSLAVVDGKLTLTDDSQDELTNVNVAGATSWSSYVFSARIQGESQSSGKQFGAFFYYTDISNYYAVIFDTFDKELILRKVVAGTPTDIATVDMSLQPFFPDVWYGLRVSIVDEGGSNRIEVFIDANKLIDELDSAHAQGTIGLFHTADATIECDDTEVLGVPAESDYIDINT